MASFIGVASSQVLASTIRPSRHAPMTAVLSSRQLQHVEELHHRMDGKETDLYTFKVPHGDSSANAVIVSNGEKTAKIMTTAFAQEQGQPPKFIQDQDSSVSHSTAQSASCSSSQSTDKVTLFGVMGLRI